MIGLFSGSYFLDLWHWRAQRSNPLGLSDDQYVADAPYGDSGRSGWSTNWDGETQHPRMMFDPEQVGFHALSWDAVVGGGLGLGDVYYLSEQIAVPFDPDHAWQEGDTIPRRLLRAYQGSREDVGVHGQAGWADGYWDVTLTRLLDTGSPMDDKILDHKGIYHVAFAVHRNATEGGGTTCRCPTRWASTGRSRSRRRTSRAPSRPGTSRGPRSPCSIRDR